MAAPFGRPRTTPREVCPVPPDVHGGYGADPKTDARNERSRGAMEALPAKFEGIFRKHMRMPVTGVRDSAYFSVVDDEWPSVRQNLEQRLAGAREVGSA
jgi:hypothetical protein